jgi:UPF0716 protein FxsA
MFTKLLLLFMAIPLAEVALLIEVGSRIGVAATLLILIGTAVLGASLAHREGLRTWWRLQSKIASGVTPDEELLDGLLILIAGAMLLTPGLLTDAGGLFLLVPSGRQRVKRWLRDKFSQRLQVQHRAW